MNEVKKLIKLTGLNQTQFGNKVGLDKTRISKYASGKVDIPLSLYLNWLAVFNFEINLTKKD